jgi:pyruvate/2-oxoglutarate dehydrogenase complex dihydrolipoamide dehydrogenase (E3) component
MTSTDTRDGFDAVVLGAGEAGTIVASLAVESGLSVALVYRELGAARASMWVVFRASF